eukprot:940864-Rhodomonas_salina.1
MSPDAVCEVLMRVWPTGGPGTEAARGLYQVASRAVKGATAMHWHANAVTALQVSRYSPTHSLRTVLCPRAVCSYALAPYGPTRSPLRSYACPIPAYARAPLPCYADRYACPVLFHGTDAAYGATRDGAYVLSGGEEAVLVLWQVDTGMRLRPPYAMSSTGYAVWY